MKINVKKLSLAKIENTVLSIWDSKNNQGDDFGTEPKYVHLPEQERFGLIGKQLVLYVSQLKRNDKEYLCS